MLSRSWLLLALLGISALLFLLPSLPSRGDLERAELIRASDHVLLVAKSGQFRIDLSPQALSEGYSSSNPYDFFASLVDRNSIDRIEIVPYDSGIVCNLVTYTGKSYASRPEYCMALALRLNIPVYISRELLRSERSVNVAL